MTEKPNVPHEIAALLKETRRFDPPDAWRTGALMTDPGIYEYVVNARDAREFEVRGRSGPKVIVDP